MACFQAVKKMISQAAEFLGGEIDQSPVELGKKLKVVLLLAGDQGEAPWPASRGRQ